MNDCTFLSPTRLVIGRDAENQTARWIREAGGTRVMVHHDDGYVKQSGLVDRITALLRDNPQPTDTEIREGLSGNFCRCTGYQGIVNAVHRAAESYTPQT